MHSFNYFPPLLVANLHAGRTASSFKLPYVAHNLNIPQAFWNPQFPTRQNPQATPQKPKKPHLSNTK